MSKPLHNFLVTCLLFVGLFLTSQSSLAAQAGEQAPSLTEIAGELKEYKNQIDNIKACARFRSWLRKCASWNNMIATA